MFLDVDVLIMDYIDDFFKHPGSFCIIRDWWWEKQKPGIKKFNSSVMRFEMGKHTKIWHDFEKDWRNIVQNYPGDQDWITEKVPNATTWPDAWCKSYKWHKGYEQVLPDTKIMVFHGNPNPDEAIRGFKRYPPAPWIGNVWR